jgi:hypothetical protein
MLALSLEGFGSSPTKIGRYLCLLLTSVNSVSSDPGEVLKSPNCQAAHHRQPDPEASRVAHLFAFSPFNFGLSTLLLSGVHMSIILWDLLCDLRFLCFHTLTHSFARCDPATPFHSIPSALFGKNTRVGYTPFKPRTSGLASGGIAASLHLCLLASLPRRMEQMPRSHVFTGAEVRSMRRFMMGLGIAMLMAAVLTMRPLRSRADDSIQGDWSARLTTTSEGPCVQLELDRSSWGHHNRWGNSHKLSDFTGLDASLATAKDSQVHFEMRRDAGTISFDGRFSGAEGHGKFTFASSSDYVQGMKALGYSGLSNEQLFGFTMHDVSRQFVKDMADAGYRAQDPDQLMAFRIHGVSPEFARAMQQLLPSKPSADDLVAFRIHGASPEFARGMMDVLPEKPSADNLVAMRIHGVNPEDTKQIDALLGKRFDVEQLVAFRIHGVSPDFVREVRASVSKDVSADDLVAMRIHGASPEFVKSMSSLMGRNLPVEQLVAFRIHGVSPEFTEEIQKLVEKNISSDDLVAFRIHGVSPEFVKSMKEAGYSKISPDQLVAMRIHGVDADFVKEVRAHGYKDPTIDDLIELRIHGLRHRESL